jgi:hypothetical protein
MVRKLNAVLPLCTIDRVVVKRSHGEDNLFGRKDRSMQDCS